MSTEYYRRYQKEHKKELNANHKRYRDRVKMKVYIHYGGDPPQCACCGETHIEFLTIHHKNGGGNKHRRELNISPGVNFHRWLLENNFPTGYQILCFNCNCVHGVCPHMIKRETNKDEGARL